MRQTISTSSQACHHIILDTAQGLGDPVMSAGASSIGLVLNSQNFWTEGSDLERTWESQIPQPPPLSPGDTLHPVIRKNCCIYEHHQIQTRHDLLISDVYNAYAPTISDRMITIWLSLYAKAALQCINRFCPQVCQKGLATRKRIKSIQVSIGIYYNSNMRPG